MSKTGYIILYIVLGVIIYLGIYYAWKYYHKPKTTPNPLTGNLTKRQIGNAIQTRNGLTPTPNGLACVQSAATWRACSGTAVTNSDGSCSQYGLQHGCNTISW